MDPEFLAFLTGKGISEARYEAGSLSYQAVLIHEFNESKKIAGAPGKFRLSWHLFLHFFLIYFGKIIAIIFVRK
jgi:hypothetical protein